jgi:hypothetical protein
VLDAALPGAEGALLCPACGDVYTRKVADGLVCADCLAQVEEGLVTVVQEVALLVELWTVKQEQRGSLLEAIRRRSEPLWVAASILGDPDLAMIPETIRVVEAAAAHNTSLLLLGLARAESGEARLRCIRALRYLNQALTAPPVIGTAAPESTLTP